MPNLTRKTFILAANEAVYGTDAIPTPASSANTAVRVISAELNPITGDRVQRQTLQPFLGQRKPMLARDHVALTITLELGSSGTAGTAPRFGPLLQCCGLSANATGTAVTGTATAVGTSGGNPTVTLAAGASATDDFYVGMRLQITSGAQAGAYGIIAAYSGNTRVATVYTKDTFPATGTPSYEISANVQYVPISTFDGQANTSATIVCVKDNNLHKITGFRGNLQLSGELNGYPTAVITGVGKYVGPIASTGVTAAFGTQAEPEMFEFDAVGPVSFMNFNTPCVSSFSLDFGNNAIFRNLVNCSEQALITDRNVTGSMTFENPNVATSDFFTRARDNSGASDGQWIMQLGLAAGRRFGLYARRCGVGGDLSFSDMDGVDMLTVPAAIYPSAVGNDEVVLTFG